MKQFWPLSHEIYPAKVDQLKIFDDQKIQNAFCTSFFFLTPRITFLGTKIWTFQISSTVKMSKFEKLFRKGPLPTLWFLNLNEEAIFNTHFWWNNCGIKLSYLYSQSKQNFVCARTCTAMHPASILSLIFKISRQFFFQRKKWFKSPRIAKFDVLLF